MLLISFCCFITNVSKLHFTSQATLLNFIIVTKLRFYNMWNALNELLFLILLLQIITTELVIHYLITWCYIIFVMICTKHIFVSTLSEMYKMDYCYYYLFHYY